MTGETSAAAFVQLDAERFVSIEGPVAAVASGDGAGPALLAPDFSLHSATPWWWRGAAPGSRLTREEWRKRFGPAPEGLPPLSWERPDEEMFRKGYLALRSRLDAGVLLKGVPVSRSRAPLGAADAPRLFRQLLAAVADLPPSLLAYGLFLQGDAGSGPEFIVGATPELLFEVLEDGRLRTMAVAGTTRAESGADLRLEHSEKDAAEHRAVVEDLLSQLSSWGAPTAGPRTVRQFGGLCHLVTEIEMTPTSVPGFDELVAALHPTPALGVSPRGRAGDAWLREIDPAGDRRRFGAPFGVRWPSGAGRALVAIRNLQYRDGYLEIWAGCGVVAASEYDAEWQEVQDKIGAVRALWKV